MPTLQRQARRESGVEAETTAHSRPEPEFPSRNLISGPSMTASSPTNLADCTATELLQLYRTRQASPLEATQAVLSRIANCDKVLNAFCLIDPDSALAAARESSER